MTTITKEDNQECLEEIIKEAINLKDSLIEKGFREDDIAFFMTMDIQRDFTSFVSEVLNFEIEPSKKFIGCPLHLIQGENNIYIGIKI